MGVVTSHRGQARQCLNGINKFRDAGRLAHGTLTQMPIPGEQLIRVSGIVRLAALGK